MANKEYIEFMYNKDNICKCEGCPENYGFKPGADDKLPCGQYNCWVAIHCARSNQEDE